ncbi:hypothetical protein ACFLZZ_01885 [Nanoarchaeota archaeon]
MTVIGFTFSKIHVDRKATSGNQQVDVKSQISMNNVEERKISLPEGQMPLKFDFSYDIEYTPDLASIKFAGTILVALPSEKAKEILEGWKKNKTISDQETKLAVYNTIFNKCNVKAFELEEDMGLPLHLRLPQIGAENTPKK